MKHDTKKLANAADTNVMPPEVPIATIGLATENILTAIDSRKKQHHHQDDIKCDGSTPNETITEPQDASLEAPARSKLRLGFILLALFLSLFCAALDATIVATAVPVISHDLESAAGYTWIGGSYLLALAAAGPIWAKLSDIWGRKLVIVLAIVLFAASSAVCGSAQTMQALIIGRAFQGVAGGGLILLVHVVTSDLFSVRQRSLVMGITEGVWALAGGVGPILGGVFASLVSWRWCFYINLPIEGVALVLTIVFLDVKHEKTGFWEGVKAIDWYGTFAFLAFVIMLLLGLDFGGVVFPWDSAKVICLIVIGACMVGVFVYSQAKLARYPLMPLHVFRNRTSLAAIVSGFIHGYVFIPAEYYLPLYFQAVKQATPLRSGILLVPLIVATAGMGVLSGIIIHRTGQCRELIWAGMALITIGSGLFTIMDEDTSTGEAIGLTVFFGIGSGMLFEAPLIAVQSHSKQQDVATATSTFTFVRSIGISISVIVGGVVFQNSMDGQAADLRRAGLPANVLQELSGKYAAANVALAGTLADLSQRKAIERAFAMSMKNMWYMYAAFGALGFIVALFVGRAHLSEDHTETVTGLRKEKDSSTELVSREIA